MSTVSIFFVLLSASIHVGWNFLTKSSRNPKIFSLQKVTVMMGFAALVVPWFPIQDIPVNVWIYIILSGIIHGLYIVSLSSAYEVGDISYVYPIARSAPAFVPLAAFLLLGEKISFQGGIGILVVIIGMYILLMRGETSREIHRLWTSMKKKDSVWAIITLFTVVAYTITDKAGMSAFGEVKTIYPLMQGPLYFFLENVLCCCLFWVYMMFRSDEKFKSILSQDWAKPAIAALGTLVSYSLILYVMRSEKVSYIVTMRQVSVLIAVFVGRFLLNELHGKMRLAATVIMFIGFYLVGTAN